MTPPTIPAGLPRPEIVTEQMPKRGAAWLAIASSGDHKDVGRMYLATALAFGAFALVELLMMRVQLSIPDSTLMRPEVFDRLLSAYGVTALVLFAIPLALALMTYVVPLQIGARAVALPRLNALSYWLYLAGAVTIYLGFLWHPSEAGTTALAPLSDTTYSETFGVDFWAAGLLLVVLGFVFWAINMFTTIRNHRAPGMVGRRMPIFAWAAATVSGLLLFIGPVMIAALTMLLIDRNFDGVFFDALEGGAPSLYEHLSWIFFTGGYVAVVIAGFGIISEIFATFSRQPQFGHRTLAGSLIAFAVLGVLAWMQNMYSAPIGIGWLYFAMLMAVAAVIPIGLIYFNWIATLSGGRRESRLPMTFALGAAVVALVGLAGEWAQSVIPVGWQVANTGVAWGDTHLTLIGAGVLGGFAGLYYWFPKITGRLMGDSLGRASFAALIAGSFVMVLPIQLAGLEGMPVDVYKFFGDTGMSAYNLIGSLGALIFAAGLALTLVNAAASYNNGAETGPDPWSASTLEWFAASPPPVHNFDLIADVRSAEPLNDIRDAVRTGTTTWTPPPVGAPAPTDDAVDGSAGDEPAPVAVGVAAESEETATEASSSGSGSEPAAETESEHETGEGGASEDEPTEERAESPAEVEAAEEPTENAEAAAEAERTEAEGPGREDPASEDDSEDDDGESPVA